MASPRRWCAAARSPRKPASVPLSKTGDATVNAKVSVPGDCVKPVIVLRERYEGKIGGWLAATSM